MEKNSVASLLTSVDSLFTTQEERDIASQPRVQEIPIDMIDDFPNHPFKVRMDDNMIEMAESVKQHGILVPAIVRPKENHTVIDLIEEGLYPMSDFVLERNFQRDRKSTRLNSSHVALSRMPSSA